MSDEQLHEMDNQVTKGASAAEPMPKAPNYVPDAGSVEVLGGPTPTNSKPTDDSNKLKTPSATLAQTGDPHFRHAGAKTTLPGPAALKATGYGKGANEETAKEEEVVAETPAVETETTVSETETVEAPVVTEEPLDIDADVKALLEGEELSEKFQEKAKTIFEAVIKSKLADAKEAMSKQYDAMLAEEVNAVRTELTEHIDSYLEYVANEWINENALAVETGIRGELSESFMTGLKGLFEEHYVTIPDDKYDVLEAMVAKLDEMESKLNEQIDGNIALTKRLSDSVSDNILDEVSEGLALSQKEKLSSLAEGVEFESEEQYREKLVTLKESYFSNKPVTDSQEVISEDAVEENSSTMSKYLEALTKFN